MTYEIYHAPKAVILADGAGSWRHPLPVNSATALWSIGGSVLIERMIRNCLSYGVSQFVLVLGHEADALKAFVDKTFRAIRITYVINDRYRDTNTGRSLMLASQAIGGSAFIKLDADVVFDSQILGGLLATELSDVLCIDRNITQGNDAAKVFADDQMRVMDVSRRAGSKIASGVSIGIEKISAKTGPMLFSELNRMTENALHTQDCYENVYARLIADGTVFHALDITGMSWTAIKTDKDLLTANTMFGSPITTVSRGQQQLMDEAAEKDAVLI